MRKIPSLAALVIFTAFAFIPLALAQVTPSTEHLKREHVLIAEKAKPGERKVEEEKTDVVAPRIPIETIAVCISIFSGLAAITGFSFSSHRKKRAISKYMNDIDSTFAEFKMKTKRCEAELYRLHDVLEDELKKGKIDESLYDLLTKRIDKYIAEVQKA